MYRHLLYTVGLLLFLYAQSIQSMPEKNVLVLHSYHPGFGWTDRIEKGIRNTFSSQESFDIHVYTEYLDTKRHNYRFLLDHMVEHLMVKYAGHHFDCVVVSDDNAYTLLQSIHDTVFPGVPIVFCGINSPNVITPASRKYSTGITEYYDVEQGLALIHRLHPGMEQLVVISDSTITGGLLGRHILSYTSDTDIPYRVTYIDSMPEAKIPAYLEKLPDESVILLLTFFRIGDDEVIPVDQATRMLGFSGHPVYTCWEFFIRNGVIGGLVISGFHTGQEAAGLVLRIFQGENPAEIPVMNSTLRPVFDYDALNKNSIPNHALPSESIILNKPVTIFTTHPVLSYSLVGLIVLLFVSIISLWLNFMNRLHAEQLLSSVITHAPDIIVLTDSNNTTILVNPAIQQITGVPPEEHIKKDFPLLDSAYTYRKILGIPRETETTVQEYTDTANNTRYLEINSVPIRYRGQHVLLSILRDITVRREYETRLKQSVREKTVLIHEIHHRVKNNLQIIISLLELQHTTSADKEQEKLLRTIQSRIISMSLVHDMLYTDENLSQLDSRSYFTRLLETLCSMYCTEVTDYSKTIDIDSVPLLSDTAVPLGLISTEIITNSIKHGRSPDGRWTFSFTFRRTKDSLVLHITDNGPGFDFRAIKNRNLGLNLVESLVMQLGGTTLFASDNGSSYTITVPFPGPQELLV